MTNLNQAAILSDILLGFGVHLGHPARRAETACELLSAGVDPDEAEAFFAQLAASSPSSEHVPGVVTRAAENPTFVRYGCIEMRRRHQATNPWRTEMTGLHDETHEEAADRFKNESQRSADTKAARFHEAADAAPTLLEASVAVQSHFEGTGVASIPVLIYHRAAIARAQQQPAAMSDDTRCMNDDVLEMLRVLGIPDHARPVSCHRVVQDEILPEMRALKQQPGSAERPVDDTWVSVTKVRLDALHAFERAQQQPGSSERPLLEELRRRCCKEGDPSPECSARAEVANDCFGAMVGWIDELLSRAPAAKPEPAADARGVLDELPVCRIDVASIARLPEVEARSHREGELSPAPARSTPSSSCRDPDWLSYCPTCGGTLDTGWECNRCGRDWISLIPDIAKLPAPDHAEDIATFASQVLRDLGLSEWDIAWENGGGGCVHPESKRISLGRQASKAMLLHEVAHILEPHKGGGDPHNKHWASRFTDLVGQFLESAPDHVEGVASEPLESLRGSVERASDELNLGDTNEVRIAIDEAIATLHGMPIKGCDDPKPTPLQPGTIPDADGDGVSWHAPEPEKAEPTPPQFGNISLADYMARRGIPSAVEELKKLRDQCLAEHKEWSRQARLGAHTERSAMAYEAWRIANLAVDRIAALEAGSSPAEPAASAKRCTAERPVHRGEDIVCDVCDVVLTEDQWQHPTGEPSTIRYHPRASQVPEPAEPAPESPMPTETFTGPEAGAPPDGDDDEKPVLRHYNKPVSGRPLSPDGRRAAEWVGPDGDDKIENWIADANDHIMAAFGTRRTHEEVADLGRLRDDGGALMRRYREESVSWQLRRDQWKGLCDDARTKLVAVEEQWSTALEERDDTRKELAENDEAARDSITFRDERVTELREELAASRTEVEVTESERNAAQAEAGGLRGELAEAKAWQDRAVESCAKKRCSMRDRQLREAENELAALRAASLLYYNADGSARGLTSADDVIERRKKAARELAALRAKCAVPTELLEDAALWRYYGDVAAGRMARFILALAEGGSDDN